MYTIKNKPHNKFSNYQSTNKLNVFLMDIITLS